MLGKVRDSNHFYTALPRALEPSCKTLPTPVCIGNGFSSVSRSPPTVRHRNSSTQILRPQTQDVCRPPENIPNPPPSSFVSLFLSALFLCFVLSRLQRLKIKGELASSAACIEIYLVFTQIVASPFPCSPFPFSLPSPPFPLLPSLSSLLSPGPSSHFCHECPSRGRRAGCQRGPRPARPRPTRSSQSPKSDWVEWVEKRWLSS